MVAPNIVGVTTITGITTSISLANTSANVIVSNPANSQYVYKINSIIVANDDGAATANITLNLHDSASGAGTATRLAFAIDVSAKSTLVILDKASSIYLPENASITATASAANDLDVTCSYEAIID